MRLYSGTSRDFIQDSVQNRIAGKLSDAFLGHFRYRPPESEVRSWRESLRALSQVFEHAKLLDHGVLLEYQLPLTSRRLDCLVAGHDGASAPQAVIVELKQWQRCEITDGDELVRTWVGGGDRDVLHPSAQAGQYCNYLADTHTAFYEPENSIKLAACAYLHNYFASPGDALFDPKFDQIRTRTPLFDADDVPPLTDFLVQRLGGGDGMPVIERIEQSQFRPSRKLLDHVADVVRAESSFVLLDEQRVVYQKVLARIRSGVADRRKQVFIVHGGPGTGKSVVAINLLADLAREGFNSQYATGSRAFTKTLHKIVGARASAQFKYFHNYGEAAPNDVAVLINDEAHRIRDSSNNRYTPASKKRTKKQIEELVDAAKVSVFLIDDKQVVRPNEVGSSELIRETARARGCETLEYRLEAQFRCAGSDAFVNWVNNTLGIERTANPIWDQRQETFEFRIFDSPEALESAIKSRSAAGASARVTAGFCWPWSKTVRPDGTLQDDVVIGDYHRPWNAPSEAKGLARGIPREVHWARDPRGIDQIGCIYTAQGFEFDYVGVIWGPDLIRDADAGAWVGVKTRSHDTVVKKSGDRFVDLVKNTYRVLLTRGMKGCYVCFLDKATEQFVRSRTEGLDAGSALQTRAAPVTRHAPAAEPALPFRKLAHADVRPFRNSVPLWDLKIAAGVFRAERPIEIDTVEWVELPPEFQHREGLFVARVIGESMNRRIPNGAWCLFRLSPGGSKQGKVVVATHRSIRDPEVAGNYTVKVYESEKVPGPEGAWAHSKVTLKPHSTSPDFKPLVFEGAELEELGIVAELVAVLG